MDENITSTGTTEAAQTANQAQPSERPEAQETKPAKQGEAQETQQGRTFTQEDLDRIITERLAKERSRQEKEKSEAARLAAMSAEDRAKAELEKEREKFEQERAQFEAERMEMETTRLLAEEKLPVEFAPILRGQTAEETKGNVTKFKDAFRTAVEAAVLERVRGSGKPRSISAGMPDGEDGVEREFRKLNPKLRQ